MKLVIHPTTERQLQAFINAPSHALVLVGPSGSGKRQLATWLAEAVLNVTNLDSYPYGRVVSAENGQSIGIESVREIEKMMNLKVPSDKKHNRAVIIENAHYLTLEAQNAFLKTLEEPPEGVVLILTANQPHALLPTIRSRTQAIPVNRPDRDKLEKFFGGQGHDSESIKQAYTVSGGLPGLMHALLNEEDHPLVEATSRARQLLSQTAYERLLAVDELSKRKELALDTTFILQQMAHVSLQSASGAAAKRWQRILTASYKTSEALHNNAQPKLALTQLMLHL